jgi:AcrR family transcriptional regulator
MATPPRKRLSRAERRRLIEEAAAALFAEHGYAATRLEDIAARAGVTKQLLYQHFADKPALYLALLQRHRDDLASFVQAVPAEGSLEERLRAVVDVWLDYVETHAYAWTLLFRDTGGGPEIQRFRVEVHARARDVLAGLLRALSVEPLPERELEPLAELLSMGQAALVLWWLDDPARPREAVLDAITRTWHGVLTSERTRASS